MAKITFEEIMARYGGNKTAYTGLKESCKKSKTVPFVGAGLCVPFGYKQWSGLLKELATLLTDEIRKAKVNMMIDLGELLEAAQEIRNHAGDLMFDALQHLVSIDIYKQCDVSVRQDSAVMLLPKLFPSTPVITTNFDQVLENVYTEVSGDYLNKCTPFDQSQLTQLSQKNAHILLKLHGDIGSGICSTDKLVFTKRQYEVVYAPEAPITEALFNLFRNNAMLFLGASLEQDRTTDILEAVHEKYPDTRHYAILSYPKTDSELKETLERLHKLGVLPIFFPTGQYEAIRVILEELLGQSSPNPSAKLPQQNHSDTDKSPFARMAYDSDYVDFVGRAKEMSLLEEFCQKDDPILWWAVTAPGGMGKSRLVHEFTKHMEAKGWNKLWLRKEECGSLSDLRLPPGDCILVTDDVQGYFHDLKKYLPAILEQNRDGKLRILLLERDGKDLMSSSWGEMVVIDPYENPLDDYTYSREFLQLKPLSAQDLTAIMTNYAEKLGHPITSDKVADKLLKALTDVDKELLRPLYAQAIADAWCNADSPTKWTRNQLLDKLLKRELSFFFNRLQSILGEQPTKSQCNSLERLLAYSCVLEPLLLDHMEQTLCAGLCPSNMELSDFLERLGVVRKVTLTKRILSNNGEVERVETTQPKAVILECPDLVKEYLVIRKAFVDNGWKELLLPKGWMDDYHRLWYIRRLMIDYPDVLEQKTLFLNAFFVAEPETDSAAFLYSYLLYGFTVVVQKFAQRAVDRLEALHKTFEQNEQIASQYANGLCNLTFDQVLTKCEDSVRKLEAIHKAFDQNEEIALQYASGLVNLTVEQDQAGREGSVRKLQALHETFEGNAEITLEYAKGLFNLSVEQDLTKCKDSVRKLESLYEAFKEHAEIALPYARGLFTLTIAQNLNGCKDSVDKLKVLHETFGGNVEIASEYAVGLFSLSLQQPQSSSVELSSLIDAFKSNAIFAEGYTLDLSHLSYEQWRSGRPESEVEQTLSQVRTVANQFPENPDIQLNYAVTWFNLTLVQTGEARTATIQSLRKYLETHQKANQEFQAKLDTYLSNYPDQKHLYAPLRI